MALALQAHRVADEFEPTSRDRVRFAGLMGLALLVAYVTSAASGLYCYYTYATPISSRVQQPVLNDHMLGWVARQDMVNPMNQHAEGAFAPKAHRPGLHVAIGAGVMTVLQLGAWASPSWPIAPIGYLLGTTWYPQLLWWSLFLGWLVKALIVRFGGAPMYMAAKPFFVGLVFGECLAATFWLAVSFALAMVGLDYIEIRLLPT